MRFMRHGRALGSAILILSLSLVIWSCYAITKAPPARSTGTAVLITIKGAIGPAVQDYVHRGLKFAAKQRAKVVVLQIDTPGGLDKAMRGIVRDILSSTVPVVAYVAPSGARAASAGTFVLYASNVAAMAPGTNLGAASPVSIGMPAISPSTAKKKPAAAKPQSTMLKKAKSDAAAYIRSLAQLRGRNVKWAEKAVTKAASISAKEALKLKVIDIIAPNITVLLQKIDGWTVVIAGQKQKLTTKGLVIEKFVPGWRTRFLTVITDPSVAYILLMVGIWGLFFEFANPGFVLPGVVGVIALLISFYAFQLLPINYVGLGLIIAGIAFMLLEAFMPSFGALGLGGIIAFVVGSIMLMDTNVPGFKIALPVIIAVSVVTAAFFLIVIHMAIKSRLRPVKSGREELIGGAGVIIIDKNGEIKVKIHSEVWNVKSTQPLKAGQQVKVIAMQGLVLTVEPITLPK